VSNCDWLAGAALALAFWGIVLVLITENRRRDIDRRELRRSAERAAGQRPADSL
jgi:hypothetical protein